MEHLIDLVLSEFNRAGYELIGETVLKHKEHSDFWVIAQLNEDYDMDALQESIFNSLAELHKDYPESEKNTSLLILHQLVDEANRNIKRVIDDENNVFYFKKYVIQYTDAEWNAAKALHSSGDQDLGNLLMESSVFEQLKHNDNTPYKLLYTVAHKLPFIMMRAERKSYNPNPEIQLSDGIRATFDWIEQLPDTISVNDAEIVIDQLINTQNDEQHQN